MFISQAAERTGSLFYSEIKLNSNPMPQMTALSNTGTNFTTEIDYIKVKGMIKRCLVSVPFKVTPLARGLIRSGLKAIKQFVVMIL